MVKEKTSPHISLAINSIRIRMEEIAMPHMPPEKAEEFDRINRLLKFYLWAMDQGWETLDWQRLHREMKLSKRDYTIFSKELGGIPYPSREEQRKMFDELLKQD